MNRFARCTHGFVSGLCVVVGCPHQEPRGYVEPNGTARRLRRLGRRHREHRCWSPICTNPGVVKVYGGNAYSCQSCLHKVGSRGQRQLHR